MCASTCFEEHEYFLCTFLACYPCFLLLLTKLTYQEFSNVRDNVKFETIKVLHAVLVGTARETWESHVLTFFQAF